MQEDEIKYSNYNEKVEEVNEENQDPTEQDLMSNYELLNQKYKIKPPKIVVFGVGGGGCNVVNSIYNSGDIDESVSFIVANTDLQSLNISNVKNKILLGRKTTGGYGAGRDPKIGRAAAEESLNEIEQFLRGASMIFLTSGMGGGTGTGATPVVAKKAKEMGILVATIVTKPFAIEGALSLKMANDGIAELKKYTDTLIIIPNQNLSKVVNPKTTMQQSFAFVDRVLQSGIKSIVDLITKTGVINRDFSDVRTVMKKPGRAVMGIGEASGANRAVRAVEEAISNPLLDNISIRGAKAVIMNITSPTNFTFYEYQNAAKRLNEEIDDVDNAILLLGNVFDPEMKDIVRVSIFATGIGSDDEDEKIEKTTIKDEIKEDNTEKVDDFVEQEYSYVENLKQNAADDNDFFDLGDTKKYDEVAENIKEYKKGSDYNKIVQKINKITSAKEVEVKNTESTEKYVKQNVTDGKKGFFSILFGGKEKTSKTEEEPKHEQKKSEKSNDLSIVEVENFDNIDIDVYEVPAYLRKKNE